MKLGKTRWLLVGVFCLLLWPAAASAQDTQWEKTMAAAVKAYEEGCYAEAEKLLLAALKQAEKLGPNDPRLTASLNNLAGLYEDQGKDAQAEPLYQRSLAILEKSLGPDHPHIALSLNNLAALYDNQGSYTQAEPLYQQALAIREKTVGPDHPKVAESLENYAALLRKMNREAEAEKLEARAKAIRDRHAQENPKE